MIKTGREMEGAAFHTFRDEIKTDYSFRVIYSYSSREYTLETPRGPGPIMD